MLSSADPTLDSADAAACAPVLIRAAALCISDASAGGVEDENTESGRCVELGNSSRVLLKKGRPRLELEMPCRIT